MLANGSIVVIGGEKGANDIDSPNLEILPKPLGGDTVVDLPWLLDATQLNLYPFVTVLPSGNLFIGWYRLLYLTVTDGYLSSIL